MGDSYRNVAKGHARVGAQIGRLDGNVDMGVGVAGSSDSTRDDIAALLTEVRAELRAALKRNDIDTESADAVEAELDAAAACLPMTNERAENRFVVAMKKAKGLVEGLSALTVKVTAAIAAVRGLQ